MILPKRNIENFIVQKLDSETLVYDRSTLRASCLNSFAADVWDCCDGQSSVGEIAAALSRFRDSAVQEKEVWAALELLDRANLLEEAVILPKHIRAATNRRDALRAIGLGAAAAIPAVATIIVPTVADAASCVPTGGPCSLNDPGACCSRICINHVNGPYCG
jgi:hypothetical protein